MDLELLSELLMETGALSVVIEDANRGTDEELPIFDEPESKGGSWYRVGSVASGDNFWRRCNVTAYYPFGWDLPGVVSNVAEQFELPVLPRYTVDDVPDEDWVKRVQQDWTPLLVGELLLRFPWHSEADVSAVREAGGVKEGPELLLEGGMAFGTGEHPTTRLCCQWLQRQIRAGSSDSVRVLDYGAGSGVLGLAALRFGAAEAVGVEIDKGSILAAESNAELNKLAFRCHLPSLSATDAEARDDLRYAAQLRSDMNLDSSDDISPLPPSDTEFDLTVANILAGPLVRLAPEIARLTKAGGGLGLSGILSTQAQDVVEAYREFFDEVKVEEQENEWVLVTGVRKK